MRYTLIIMLMLPCATYSACFKNGNLETIDYWYYHHGGTRQCIEKLKIKPSESICNTENNRQFHFIKRDKPEAKWLYYSYEDKTSDRLIFRDDIIIVNNNVIKGKKTKIDLTKSKAVELCNEPITIHENQCSSKDVNFALQKLIIIAVMDYIFLENEKENLFYKDILIDSKIIDLAIELQLRKIRQKQESTSYHFKNFTKCDDYLKVYLISYSAPKASFKKVFIIKIIDNKLEVIKEDMLWISYNRSGQDRMGQNRRGLP